MLRTLSLAAAIALLAQAAIAQAPAVVPEAPKRPSNSKVLESDGIWVNKRAVAYVDDTPVRIFRPAASAAPPSAQLGVAAMPATDLWFVPANELIRSK